MDKIEVTQADRDLFISVNGISGTSETASRVNRGLAFTYEVEQIARVRLAAEQRGAERMREAMKGPLAWLERWAVHVGSCETGPVCTCGLMLAQHELRQAIGTGHE